MGRDRAQAEQRADERRTVEVETARGGIDLLGTTHHIGMIDLHQAWFRNERIEHRRALYRQVLRARAQFQRDYVGYLDNAESEPTILVTTDPPLPEGELRERLAAAEASADCAYPFFARSEASPTPGG